MNKIIWAYAIVGLLTFGYSYNADYRPGDKYVSAEERNTIGGLIAAIGWPVYWTTYAFRFVRPASACEGTKP